MHTQYAIKGAPPHAELLSEREYIPADRRHCGDMLSRPDTELTPDQRAWVDDYAAEEKRLERAATEPARCSAGRVARAAKYLLVEGACRGLLPGRVVSAAFARWPALRSA